MKMHEVLSLQDFYVAVKDSKLPLKTAYKLSRLMKRVEEEMQFYNQEFSKILDEYAKKENNNFVFSKDGTSIEIIPGKEEECNNKIIELKTLEIDLNNFSFTLDEFDGIDLTISEMNSLLPLIKD